MEKYQRLAYLLGCYMIVSDREINTAEVDILEKFLPAKQTKELNTLKQLIFSDDEDRPKLSDLLSELKLTNLAMQEKREVVKILADIAYGDDFLAEQEKLLLNKVSTALDIDPSHIVDKSKENSKSRLASLRLSETKRVIGRVESFVYNIFQKENNSNIDLLLGDLGYATSIEKITDTALLDLDRVAKIIENINNSLVSTTQTLDQPNLSKKNASKDIVAVERTVTNVKAHFDQLLNKAIKENIEILNKKRKNIRYFTIVFMGRTKAGKSTLHKVITQEENDDIGVGKLRTTRYNRSWYWNRLRVVDTPGIGAPGGATDTEIARSIIDEADVICYVVTSDSIQETEFDFFSEIKERNKPLYIVLNVKSNLTQSVRLKRFLEDTNAWKDTVGPQSIQGHIDRIHEKLDGKYNMNSVEIIPIHLLAAQLGFSETQSKQEANKLRDGSNIFAFTRSVKATVHKTGAFKKSLSVIDGTAYQIHQISSSLKKDLKELQEAYELLVGKLDKFQDFMRNEKGRVVKDIKQIFSNTKSELYNRASAFASENYDNNNAGALWVKDPTVKSTFSKLDSRIQQRMEDYNDKVKSQIEEIVDDIHVLSSFKAVSSVSGESITNTRLGIGILGAIISAATPFIIANIWNPAGWIVAGVSILVGGIVSLVTSLFTSKAEKIRKATERMREKLTNSIDDNLDKNQKDFLNTVEKAIEKTMSSVSILLSTYIDGTKKIIYDINNLQQQVDEEESAINSLVGLRLLEHIGRSMPESIDALDDRALAFNYPVKRDWNNQSIAYNYKVHLTRKDIERMSQATQMNIITE
jgi:putative GTPase